MPETFEVTDRVCKLIAEQWDLEVDDLKSKDRHAHVVRARHTAMWILRRCTTLTLRQIADEFDRNDHTTVMHAVAQVDNVLELTGENEYKNRLKRICDKLNLRVINQAVASA